MKFSLACLTTLLAIATISACKKEEVAGFNSLTDVRDEAPGTNCAVGGVVITTGIDKNRNDVLDATEVQSTRYVCNGKNGVDGGYDKQITIGIPASGAASFSANYNEWIYGSLFKFHKSNYVKVDSIVFVSLANVDAKGDSCIVQLYNRTDNVPINNSEVRSGNTRVSDNNQPPIFSKNIYNDLPDKEITLGIRVRANRDGAWASSGGCYLILYRK